ncbi:Uncharacterised protein [Mycobacteroides abscessus subsp. abscessus]|nr:Uncharacterised protein [Mycobacteroides abscessus subsp. abscessus]
MTNKHCAERCCGTGKTDITGEGQGKAAAYRMPVDGRNDRLPHPVYPLE